MTFIERFFNEKDLSVTTYEIEHDGLIHYVSSDDVIELINTAPPVEQQKIASVIRKIDLLNGDIHDFLQHLMKGHIIQTWGNA